MNCSHTVGFSLSPTQGNCKDRNLEILEVIIAQRMMSELA